MSATYSSTARPFRVLTRRLRTLLRRYTVELLLLLLLAHLLVDRGLLVQVDVRDPDANPTVPLISEAALPPASAEWPEFVARLRALIGNCLPERTETDRLFELPDETEETEADPAPQLSNLTLILSPDYGVRKGLDPAVIAAKRRRVDRYVARYAEAARRDFREYGIPASITLAQALLESNAGDSRLATESNNHFGIKCRAKCLGCTCRNYGDDTRYDMFRVFTDADESFRAHGRLLRSPRYARLLAHGTDYRKWAHGLKSCGYATDPRYAEKLIQIITELQLDRYDAA